MSDLDTTVSDNERGRTRSGRAYNNTIIPNPRRTYHKRSRTQSPHSSPLQHPTFQTCRQISTTFNKSPTPRKVIPSQQFLYQTAKDLRQQPSPTTDLRLPGTYVLYKVETSLKQQRDRILYNTRIADIALPDLQKIDQKTRDTFKKNSPHGTNRHGGERVQCH